MLIVSDTRFAIAAPWVAGALWLMAAAWGVVAFSRVRRTTMAAPAAWFAASAAATAATNMFLAAGGDTAAWGRPSIGHYAAAVSCCCPLMAVLGAKRPQDRGWQWVVAALWITLLVPAGQAIAASAGGVLELDAVWKLLLGGLIAMGLLNYLPTRYALAATLGALGQTLLLSDYLFAAVDTPEELFIRRLGSPALIVLACAVAEFQRGRSAPRAADARTARWLDFRDAWGAFWALRVMQRLNQSAAYGRWPVQWAWHGMIPAEPGGQINFNDDEAAKVDQALGSLLWRFERVS